MAVTYTLTLDGNNVTPENGAIINARAVDPNESTADETFQAVGTFCEPVEGAVGGYSDLPLDGNVAGIIEQGTVISFCIRGEPGQPVSVTKVLNAAVSAGIDEVDGQEQTLTQAAVSDGIPSDFASPVCPVDDDGNSFGYCVVNMLVTGKSSCSPFCCAI